MKKLNFVTAKGTKQGWWCNTCVAVAYDAESQKIVVKNSNDPLETTVDFTHAEWEKFLEGVKNQEFELATLQQNATLAVA